MPSNHISSLTRFFIFISLLVLCFLIGKRIEIDPISYHNFLQGYPLIISAVIYMAVYIGVTSFVWLVIKDVLRIAGALFFGGVLSSFLVWVGELGNALILFHLSRKLGQEYVLKKFKISEEELSKRKKDTSMWSILALRINPLVPPQILDLAYGLTRVSFKKYFLVILIPTFIRTLWLQSILAVVGSKALRPLELMDYLQQKPFILMYSGIYFLAVLMISTIAAVLKIRGRVPELNPSPICEDRVKIPFL